MSAKPMKKIGSTGLFLAAIYSLTLFEPALLSSLSPVATAQAATPATPHKTTGYNQPEKLVDAMVEAIRAHDRKAMHRLFGPAMKMLAYTEREIDQEGIARFLAAFDQTHQLTAVDGQTRMLLVGQDEWIFPFPIVKKGNTWKFDIQAGMQEMTNRRIGRNELAAIGACRAYIDAQNEYFAMNPEQGSVPGYAMKLFSSPGKHDGLYWETTQGDVQSPLGPWFAQAQIDVKHIQKNSAPQPYHGYFFKMLMAQGPNAAGGAKAYVKEGKMTDGFALLAWPAQYNVSGLTTIACNQDGSVFSKNLGQDTEKLAKQTTLFNPDSTWKKE